MLGVALLVACFVVPVAIQMARRYKVSKPALQWPALARIVGMQYQSFPPRIVGLWEARRVEVAKQPAGARVTVWLSPSSRLRLEIGPREIVAKRAGVIVPDAVNVDDVSFERRLLARCSDKVAGARIVEPVLRQRLLELAHVDIIAQAQTATWQLPALEESETLERALEILSVIAAEMERFPLPAAELPAWK